MRALSLADQHRWLALALLLVALTLAYLALVHPWWTVPMREAGARIEQLRERQLRVRLQLAQAPDIARRLAAAQAATAARPGFLVEPTIELATASLVQRLETVVSQASPGNRSCAISNRSPLPQASNERFQKVTVQVSLRCGVAETATVLQVLEAGSPRLFIDNLTLLTQANAFLAADQNAQGSGLHVSFELSGYLRRQQPVAEGDHAR